MKQIFSALLIVVLFGVMSCSSPKKDKFFKVEYTVTSTGTVNMDTIQYKDKNGKIITLTGKNSFNYSFYSPNHYDARLYISGKLANGSVTSNLQILLGTDVEYENPYDESWSAQIPLSFSHLAATSN